MSGASCGATARLAWAVWAVWMTTATALAGGPRFITGTSGYAQAGVPMAWYTNQPMYYTDPGQLSSNISHAQSDAMVAAAAAVWNLPTANVTLAQGGELVFQWDGCCVSKRCGGGELSGDTDSGDL